MVTREDGYGRDALDVDREPCFRCRGGPDGVRMDS